MINNYISHFYQRSSHGHAAPYNIRQQAGPGSLRSVLGEPRTLPETYGPGRIQFVPGDRRADVRHPDAALRNSIGVRPLHEPKTAHFRKGMNFTIFAILGVSEVSM